MTPRRVVELATGAVVYAAAVALWVAWSVLDAIAAWLGALARRRSTATPAPSRPTAPRCLP